MEYKGLPLFYLDIDEEDNSIVDKISLVDAPAIEKNFLAFAMEADLKFSINEERREILGAVMVPDMPIYRKDPETGEGFYVQFTPDVIRKISQVFFKRGFTNSLNLQHTNKIADAFVSQSFIINSEMGIDSPKPLGKLPDGTWIASVKIVSDSLWNDVKDGKYKGFSVEGIFKMFEQDRYTDANDRKDLLDLLKEFNSLLNTTT